MRATYTVILVGSLLASTMLVPYDFDDDLAPAQPIRHASFFAENRPQVPAGKALVPFPDYWGGANEVTIYSGKVYLPGVVGLTRSPVQLRFQTGMLVFPGARWLNVSIDAPALPHDTGFDLDYITADDRRAVRVVPNKGTYSLLLEEAMNDWSPDTHTRWIMVLTNNAMDGANANVNITVGRPAGTLPGHVLVNDRWNGQDAKSVYSQKDRLNQASVGRNPVPIPDNRGPSSNVMLRGVPALDLKELQVHLHYNSSTPTNLHFRPVLTWNSPRADGYGYERQNIQPTQEQRNETNGHFLWRIPVTPEMYDSVLGSRSRWQISVNWYHEDTQQYRVSGDYHFLVLALRGFEDLSPEVRHA